MPSPLPSAVLHAALAAQDADPSSRCGEHLADYSFRFDEAATAAPAQKPMDGPWSLALTLQELRARGAGLVESSRGLRLRHAHRLPELAEAVRAHEPEVRLWLDLCAPSGSPDHGWDDLTWLHLRWLGERFPSPRGPIELRPGVSVTDWRTFRASVADRAAAGPEAPCATGLRRDLADLYARHAVRTRPEPVVQARARAA